MGNHKESRPSPRQPARTDTRIHPLVWILAGGALVRVVLWIAWANWSPLINEDARDYQGLAIRLLTSGTYANDAGQLISLRPPGYPAFVAATYSIFGTQNDAAVRALQAVLGLATVVIVYRLGTIAYSYHVGIWAAAIVCFYPSLLGYANLLLSETLFTFLVMAFTWLACEAALRQHAGLLVATGIAMGLAALTRSIVLLFSPFVGLFLILAWNGTWLRKICVAAIPLAAFAGTIVPWAIRNTRLQETLTIIDVMGGRNAMMGNYDHTPLEHSWATISIVPEDQQWYKVLNRAYPPTSPRSQGQLDKLALKYAIDFVKEHPLLTVQRDIVKFFNFWQLERLLVAGISTGHFGTVAAATKIVLALVICGAYALVLITAIFGAFCAPPSDRPLHWFLVAGILFPCVIHTLIFAHSRYHIPIVPLLAIYSAAAIVHCGQILATRWSWQFVAAVACSCIIAIGWIRELVFVDLGLAKHVIG